MVPDIESTSTGTPFQRSNGDLVHIWALLEVSRAFKVDGFCKMGFLKLLLSMLGTSIKLTAGQISSPARCRFIVVSLCKTMSHYFCTSLVEMCLPFCHFVDLRYNCQCVRSGTRTVRLLSLSLFIQLQYLLKIRRLKWIACPTTYFGTSFWLSIMSWCHAFF